MPIASTPVSRAYRSSRRPAPLGNPMTRAPGTAQSNPPDDFRRRRDRPAVEIHVVEDPGPAVENLHDVRPGLQLAGQGDRRTPRSGSRSDAGTHPAVAPPASWQAPGPAFPGRPPCRSPLSRVRRRSRSAPCPGRAMRAPGETVSKSGASRVSTSSAASAAMPSPSMGSSLGPSPSTKRTLRPRACGVIRISEKTIAASNPNRRMGCSVTSVARSGSRQRSRNERTSVRIARYSGRYRPAWRISQIGGGCADFPSSTCDDGSGGVGLYARRSQALQNKRESSCSSSFRGWITVEQHDPQMAPSTRSHHGFRR